MGDLASGRPHARFPKSSCWHPVVALDHLAYNHLDYRRSNRLSKVWMAGIDPIDLHPVGSEDIPFAGPLGCILLFFKRMRVKISKRMRMKMKNLRQAYHVASLARCVT
jgi:hypothetical protein